MRLLWASRVVCFKVTHLAVNIIHGEQGPAVVHQLTVGHFLAPANIPAASGSR